MRKLWLAALVMILIAAAGCTMQSSLQSPLTVVVATKYSHPIAKLGGFPVSLRVDGGTGKYTIDWGDGIVDDSLSHLYTPPIKSEYTIIVKSGDAVKSVKVSIVNEPPVVNPPLIAPFPIEQRGKTVLDFRYREHGCHNGAPLTATGIWDPDDDNVTLVVHVYTNGVEDTLFDANRNPVNGPVSIGVYVWFPDWTKPTPPYPFSIQSFKTAKAVIDVTATDQWGATTHRTYTYPIILSSCTKP